MSVKKSTIIMDGKEKLTDAVLVKSKEKSTVSKTIVGNRPLINSRVAVLYLEVA